jgi:bifunctional UDP-N-acetylglucosamine pyrophosphorylase/glucosamine-1-phosphate N-acetyltransferase
MLAHVLDSAMQLSPAVVCVVHGHGGEQLQQAFADRNLAWAKQDPQRGTGHAVLQALAKLPGTGVTLILYGDVPLISAQTLRTLIAAAAAGNLAWLTQRVENPTGLGRILRDSAGHACAIVEHKDASDKQRKIDEINTGFVACPTEWLRKWLPALRNNNAQGEYYLTDILAMAVAENCPVETFFPQSAYEVSGVNDREQLAAVERLAQQQIAETLMRQGVTLLDPARIDVRGTLRCELDVSIDINCLFEGTVDLAADVKIGANCILRNCRIGTATEILPFTFVDGAVVGAGARIGPYARIRPGTTLADGVHIGNFVEVKASEIGSGSKANHLSYIGDASIGENVNVGAGTITCNYDGANKHRTVIEDDVHIGSDVQLVAPITVGKGADIGAGTTVWKDVPAGSLTVNEKRQIVRDGWVRPVKK